MQILRVGGIGSPCRAAGFAAVAIAVASSSPGAVAGQETGAWSVDPEPLFRVGWRADQPDTEFFDIVAAARLPDGAIAIADRGLARVVVVEADGGLRLSAGGSGDGPGEFADLAGMVIDDGGHVHAFDAGHQRLTEWTGAGDLVGTTTLSRDGEGRRLGAVGRFESGELYAREAPRLANTRDGETARDTVGLFGLDANGVVGREIADVPGMIATRVTVGGQVATRHVMFSPRALESRFGDCLLLMAGDEPTIRVVGSGGELRGTIPVPLPVRRTSDGDRQAWIDGVIEANEVPPEAAAMIEEMGRALPLAARWPIANRILADDAGTVWVERYAAPEGPGGEWVVIDGNGAVVAEPALPDGLRLLAVEAGRVTGAWSDELDRQELRVHALSRGRGGPVGPLTGCR